MAAYFWANGMVMTFGWDDQQIPELQGRRTPELIAKILAESDENTKLDGLNTPCHWPRGGFSLVNQTEGGEA